MADWGRWSDQSVGERIKNVSTLGGIVVGGAAVTYAIERGAHALEKRLDGSAPKRRGKQVAPRYHDDKLSPRGQMRKLATENYEKRFGYKPPSDLSTGAMKRWVAGKGNYGPGRSGDPKYEVAVSRAKAGLPNLSKGQLADPMAKAQRAAKMVSTKVAKGQLKPFIAPRVAGKFASSAAVNLSKAGKVLGGAAKVLGVASGVAVAGAAGLVAYNVLTGKHAAHDPKETRARENDPGRVVASGAASYIAGGLAARLTAGIAVAGTVGTVAARAFPLGTAALAGYGAYKGYAKDGVRGAFTGAVDNLTFGQGGKYVEKFLTPTPKQNAIERGVDWMVNRSRDIGRKVNETLHGKQSDAGGRSKGFEQANKKFAAAQDQRTPGDTFERNRHDPRSHKPIREIVHKRRTPPIGVA